MKLLSSKENEEKEINEMEELFNGLMKKKLAGMIEMMRKVFKVVALGVFILYRIE